MRLSPTQIGLLELAKAQRITASTAYKRAWRNDPTPRGYPSVDRALDRLEKAEAMERLAERGELPADAFEAAA